MHNGLCSEAVFFSLPRRQYRYAIRLPGAELV